MSDPRHAARQPAGASPACQCVYVAEDWLLLASCPGGYASSRAAAPAVMGSSDGGFTVTPARGEALRARLTLHAQKSLSAAEGEALFCLYVNPITRAGAAIQAAALGTVCAGPAPSAEVLALIERTASLAAGRGDPTTVRGGVDALLQALTPNTVAPAPDPHVQTVIRVLDRADGMQLGVPDLAAVTGLSADYLRQHFKRRTGCSLSGYRLWLRLRHLAQVALEGTARGEGADLTRLSIGAGFYDSAHAAHFAQAYFGASLSALGAAACGMVDCRLSVAA
ncbi:MAG: AraC family transcriptional regulator [Burkholderiales bacterium]|nr:MAG: AraC family transcriptional regulator [Burkholderiales bacterium]